MESHEEVTLPSPDPHDEHVIAKLREIVKNILRKRQVVVDPQTTSVVNSVFLGLDRAHRNGTLPKFATEAAFAHYLARAVRNDLVDRARRAPPEAPNLDASIAFPASGTPPGTILDVHDALANLSTQDPRTAEVVELMFFGGWTQSEIAALYDLTVDQVRGEWNYAKAWLKRRLTRDRK